ncbi:MAG: tRNA lysidine(34) synthetase TilS, partial [Clostridia bacterium]|nr:tRNA lysidine(34) synthetase TilS [Clostridia bacterium]
YQYKVDSPARQAETGESLEEAARALRYDCFKDVLCKGYADVIATAHHKSDNTETVLFNLCRGASLKGIAGIKTESDGIIRPLLLTGKDEIIEYVHENHVPFVTDETNFIPDCTRNELRLNVIPRLKELFPRLDDSVSRLSELEREEDAFLDELALKEIKCVDGVYSVPASLNKVLLYRATVIVMKALGVKKDYEKKHADSVFRLSQMENGSEISLPKNVVAIKEYDEISFSVKSEKDETVYPFGKGEFAFSNGVLSVSDALLPVDFRKEGCFFVDGDKIPPTAVVRTRRDGDVFTPYKSGSRKLKEYFIDKKIPKRLRDGIILVADGENVLFCGGIEISDKIKVDKSTKNVLQLQYIKNT